jgi:hypothetical protein
VRFLREQDVTFGPQHRIFREARWVRLLSVVTGIILVGAFVAVALSTHEWFPWIIAAGMSLFCLPVISGFIHTFHPSNWLLAINPSGLWLKFRAYDNDNMSPDDIVVVQLAFSEIAWVRKVKETSITPDSEHGSRSSHHTYLELQLHDEDISILEQHLREEHKRRPAKGWKSEHYPVRIASPGRLRVEFSGSCSLITPRVSKALGLLKSQVELRPAETDLQDYTISSKDKAEQESRILELVQRGERMAAIQTVRKLYGYSLAQARQFVDDLEGHPQTRQS